MSGSSPLHLVARARLRRQPGHALGSLDAVAEVPRWFDAVTETPVVALQANLQYLIDVFEDNFAMAMDYLAVQARWLLQILDRSLVSRERLARVYGCEPEADSATRSMCNDLNESYILSEDFMHDFHQPFNYEIKEIGELELKGKNEPIKLFALKFDT